MERPLSVVFMKIVELHEALQLPAINRMPGGFHVYEFGPWQVAVNANPHEAIIAVKQWGPCTIPSMNAAIFFNGWLAGIITPFGGTLAAGSEANEDKLIAALEEQILKAQNEAKA